MSIFYIYLQFTIMNQNYFFLQYQHLIKNTIILSYMVLGLDVLFRNEKYKSYIFACCSLLSGFGLNYIVMHFNNNRMPIYPSLSYSTGYTQYNMIMNASQFSDFHVPCDTHNKRIPEVFEREKFKRWSLYYLIIWAILMTILTILNCKLIIISSCFGLLLELFSVSKLGNKIFSIIESKIFS